MTELSNDLTGLVAWFDHRRGYGYVVRDNGEKDLFVHWTNIDMPGFKTLKPGQPVSFELGENHKGPQAVNVKVLGEVLESKE
jgi:CspA family cold shock protein